MQEEVENRTVTLAVSTTKMTGRVLKWAMSKYLSHKNNKKIEKARDSPVTPCGKVTMQELKAQDPNLANIEITDSNIKDFDRVARKYQVSYLTGCRVQGILQQCCPWQAPSVPDPEAETGEDDCPGA